MILSASCPQTPNMSALYRELETGRDQGLKMLKALERAGLLFLVDAKGRKLDDLSKPEKIYVDNLCEQLDEKAIRFQRSI